MSFIFIPPISSQKLNQAQFQSKSFAPFPGMAIGEILEAGVIEKLDDRKMLITLKGVTMRADSEVHLNAGDKIQVKVEALQPQLIMRIMEGGYSEESGLADYLRWYRSNPEALSQMMTEAIRQFNSANLGKLLPYLPGEDLQKIFTIMKSLFFSIDTQGSDFLKDYLKNLGLTMESQLRQVVEGGSGIVEGDLRTESLKGLLTGLSYDLNNILMDKDTLGREEGIGLASLAEYVNSSIKTIESHQVINFILQEAENKYLFQVPILFPDGVRKGDIFIEYDRRAKGKGQKGQYRIIFFLSMDALGDMIIEADLKGDKIDCIVKCTDESICSFISSFLDELRGSLLALGCRIEMVRCVARGDLTKEKMNYYQDRVLYSREVIDLFA